MRVAGLVVTRQSASNLMPADASSVKVWSIATTVLPALCDDLWVVGPEVSDKYEVVRQVLPSGGVQIIRVVGIHRKYSNLESAVRQARW